MSETIADRIAAFIRRYMVLAEAQLWIIAVWVLHTYTIDAAYATPYLSITSAERECGKTQLLELLAELAARPWLTGRVTAAVLLRKTDAEHPTLLLDESDAAFKGEKEYAEALRGLLNTGYRRKGTASLCVGQGGNITYRDFSTYSPKAIAGIGELPDTVASRSIPIRLKRRAPNEHIERKRDREVEQRSAPLRDDIEVWAASHVDALQDARPDLPDELGGRAQDTAEPLVAIADVLGNPWPQRVRAALVELHRDGATTQSASRGVQLLGDVREAFARSEPKVDRFPTRALIEALAEDEDAPWATYSRGEPISPRQLSSLLKPYGIRPRTVRLSEKEQPKGYLLEQFEDAWKRYLPQSRPQIRHAATSSMAWEKTPEPDPPQDGRRGGSPDAENPDEHKDVADVADAKAARGAGRTIATCTCGDLYVPDKSTPGRCKTCGGVPSNVIDFRASSAGTGDDGLGDLGPERALDDYAAHALRPTSCRCERPGEPDEDGNCPKCGHQARRAAA